MPVDQDPTIRVGIDADFHVAIATATANPLFPRLVSELRSVLQEQAIAAAAVPGRAVQAADEHDAILAAISERDANGAANAMKLHLAAVEDTVTGPGRRK